MTDAALALLPEYGIPLLALIVGLGCLGVPVPSSLLLLAAGAFAGAGELPLAAAAAASLAAAVAGDNLGYALGRVAAGPLTARQPELTARACALLASRGRLAVYFSRWLVSPLGPPINLVAGAGGMTWRRYIPAEIAGEATWVGLYMALGFSFGGMVTQLADFLGSLGLFLAFAIGAGLTGRYLWRHWRGGSGVRA